MTHPAIDILIPLGPNDRALAAACARSVRAFIVGARTIYILSREDPDIPGTVFIDEASLPFSMADVRDILGNGERAGWYFQQLAKFYFPSAVPDCSDRFLVVDADTIFMKPCRFIDDGRVVFNFAGEFHLPYFEHMRRVHPAFQKSFVYSGITHCMLFDRAWIAMLIYEVERFHRRGAFWRVFLEEVDPEHRTQSGASEYEMYFSFAVRWYAPELVIKRFRWINASSLDAVRPDLYDYVSLHWYKRDADLDSADLTHRVFGDERG